MITNERQRRVTRAAIKRFEEALSDAEATTAATDLDPRLQKAMVDGIRSQLDDLRRELTEYEALRAGEVTEREVTAITDLPTVLIEGRIAAKLTQRELASKLGVPEQQVQRYEKTGYTGVGVERLQEVADAVGLGIKTTVGYRPKRAAAKRTSAGRRRR